MTQKKLEKGSQYAKYDVDGDGVVTDEELDMDERLMRLENEDKRQDAQRFMAWFALWGMLLYPSMVVISLLIGLMSLFNSSTKIDNFSTLSES